MSTYTYNMITLCTVRQYELFARRLYFTNTLVHTYIIITNFISVFFHKFIANIDLFYIHIPNMLSVIDLFG